MKSIAEQYMNWCLHYEGIQNEFCKAGINIRQHVGGPDLGWGLRTPCIKSNNVNTCPLVQFPTQEEAEKHAREVQQHINQTLSELSVGACPVCHKAVKQIQNGDCVYGTCGHRLYQGEVMPEFAAETRPGGTGRPPPL